MRHRPSHRSSPLSNWQPLVPSRNTPHRPHQEHPAFKAPLTTLSTPLSCPTHAPTPNPTIHGLRLTHQIRDVVVAPPTWHTGSHPTRSQSRPQATRRPSPQPAYPSQYR
ncbi:hypothetical protein CRENBAI_012115, partial [Crenichthys baileyi]